MKSSEFLLNLIFPPFCVVCGELLTVDAPSDQALCEKCLPKWKKAREERCPVCKCPEEVCRCVSPDLLRLRAECAHIVAYRDQSDAVGRMLLTAKDERYHSLFRFFGKALSARVDAIIPPIEHDVLVSWLPRSRTRASDAGVDQAKEMAKSLAVHKEWQIMPLFTRVKGGAQKELTADERLVHARASYRLKSKLPSLTGKTVVLVDDILTSGASMLAAAELLKQAGAARIVCLTVAKTRQKEKEPK